MTHSVGTTLLRRFRRSKPLITYLRRRNTLLEVRTKRKLEEEKNEMKKTCSLKEGFLGSSEQNTFHGNANQSVSPHVMTFVREFFFQLLSGRGMEGWKKILCENWAWLDQRIDPFAFIHVIMQQNWILMKHYVQSELLQVAMLYFMSTKSGLEIAQIFIFPRDVTDNQHSLGLRRIIITPRLIVWREF